jgi:AbrB family looped-hinge helix DNA binding protein
MDIVTISPKFQVVIPKKIRNKIGVKLEQNMNVITYDNQVVMIPVRTIQEAREPLKEISTDMPREE